MRISKVLAQNIIFNTTSQFICYFVNLKLPFDSSRELLMHFCKKYELDQGRTHLLLSELESVQKNSRYAVTWKDIKRISETRRQKRFTTFGHDANYLTIGLVVKYLNTDQDLVKLLFLNKRCRDQMKMPVYKQALLYSSLQNLPKKRIGIWRNILHIETTKVDYADLKE